MSRANVDIILSEPSGTISPRLHGHFMEHLGGCIDGGLWVGPDSPIPNEDGIRTDVMSALKGVGTAVVRWPGGCFADDYHWRDGIGPRASRPKRINMHWGDCIEENGFGTHEFFRLCKTIGAEPYLAGNLGSGTPKELRDWVEYCNFPGGSTVSDERIANGATEPFGVQWLGVGNENWGCGGNFSPEDYAAEYRRYATYLRDWGGTELKLVACGPSGDDLEWTRRFFTKLRKDFWDFPRVHGFGAHMYCYSNSTATEFGVPEWYEMLKNCLKVENLIVSQRALMDRFDPERKIGLLVDEWGAWHKPTPDTNPAFLWQQSTVRDAMVAALTLDVFHRHCDKIAMGNLAQTINVLQSLILTHEDQMVLTPTYYAFELYKPHKGGEAQRMVVGTSNSEGLPQVAGSASVSDGLLTVTLTNLSMTEADEVSVQLLGGKGEVVDAVGLTYPDGDVTSHNTFESPAVVGLGTVPMPSSTDTGFVGTLPPASITRYTVKLG